MKSSIPAAILTATFLLVPIAHAQTGPVPIGNPETDTLQLWESVGSAIEVVAQEAMAAAGQAASAVLQLATGAQQSSQPSARASTDTAQTASLATAVTSFQATEEASSSTPISTTQASAGSSSSSQPIIERVTEYEPLPSTGFVTQDQLGAQLQLLSDQLNTRIAAVATGNTTSILPENVAADGNPDVPYAAENAINNLSNVTISDASLSASEIPSLDYLSLSGGSLSGDLSVSGNATTTGTSYFSGDVGIGTSTSQDALAVDGSAYLADITGPVDTANRLYANGGSLYWAGNVIAGGATGNWTSDGTNVWRTSGDIGVGTTSPFATLSIVGTGYFTGALTAADINAANATTTDATSTNLFSAVGNFTTGLINTLSGTTLTYTAASTTNFSATGNAYFGSTATSTFDSAGDLNVGGSLTANGNVALGNATSTNFFATTASSTNLFAQTATLGALSVRSLSLSNPLSLAYGGTGQTSFGQGWVSSNGTTLTASTSPTVNYITATSTTATSTLAGNLSVSGLSNFGNVQLTGSKTYSGASGYANSFLFMPGAALFGTASSAPNGIISPFNLYISGDQVDTTTNGPGNLIDFSVDAAVSGGHTGGREAFQSALNIVGTPAATPGSAGYVGGQFVLRGSANLTGTGGSYTNYKGGAFASNANIYLTSGATDYGTVNGEEFDVAVEAGASTANKFGMTIVQTSNDANRGVYDDAGIEFSNQQNASAPGWHYGISFGAYAAQWAFATDSTLIMAQTRQAGPASPDVALNGVDFRNVTFGGYAFASPGFTVDGSGNIIGNNLYASSTSALAFGGQGAGAAVIAIATSTDPTSGSYATAFGYQALGNATSSAYQSVAVGYEALLSGAVSGGLNSAVAGNTAVGYAALKNNTTGSTNVAVGNIALASNTTGNNNTALGATALQLNTTGLTNIAIGRQALNHNTTASNNTGVGALALLNNQTGSNNTALGLDAGEGVSGDSFANNSLFGANSGFALTTGSNNIFFGYDTASTTATGSNNIALGFNINLPSLNGSNQLDIGNLIYGTGVNGALSTVSTGSIGIGTSSPSGVLTVWGSDTASSTLAFDVANSASTTDFAVFDGGNAQLSGTLSQSSDQRLKTNIQSLNASSSLSLIDELNPVTFNWIDPNKGTTPQLGFIAQQVQPIFPNLVSTTSATALTPGGTLSLNYIDLVSPIVSAIQALSSELSSIENTIANFALSFVSNDITANNELCVGSTCVTPTQFQAMVAAAGAAQGGNSQGSSSDQSASSTPDTPPIIQINGDSPAIVQVGATYNDLGATITGPQADLNLGIQTFVNDSPMSPVQIDTSAAATDTIDYVVTDQNGLTSTSTRTVIIGETGSTPDTADATSTGTSTDQ